MKKKKGIKNNMVKNSTKLGLGVIGLCAVIGTGALVKSIETVTAGTVAVVYSTGGVKPEPLKEGWHLISPIEKTVEYPVRNQVLTAENVSAMTLDGKKFLVDVRYQYETDKKQVVDMYKQLGKQDLQEVEIADKLDKDGDIEDSHYAMKSVSLNQDIQKTVKEVVSGYTLDEVYRTKSNEVSGAILKALIAKEEEKGFIINDLDISVPKLDDATQASMDAQVQETQNQQLKNQQLETAKIEAEQKRVVAEGDATKARIEAQASADAELIKAQAEAEANKLKQQTLTPELIQAQWIKAWNGALPTVQGEGMPIIQMPALTTPEAK